MRIFARAANVFDFVLQNYVQFEVTNGVRIQQLLSDHDRHRYNYNATGFQWSILFERTFKGLRQYFFHESMETTRWHRFIWKW